MKKYYYNKRDKMFSDNSLMINYRGNPPIEKDIIYLVDIEELKKESPVVYCRKSADTNLWMCFEQPSSSGDTHKGYLTFVEPIEKKECVHEPNTYQERISYACGLATEPLKWETVSLPMRCKHCGVVLEIEWKEKK